MNTISSLLKVKGDVVFSIAPDATVYDAIHKMAEEEIGALLVMDGSKLIGVISERDYARQIILKGRSSESTRVREIMTTEVIIGLLSHKIEECMGLMTVHRVRHLPILDGDKVVGVISVGDLVKAIIADQQSTIGELERYIKG